MQGSLQDWNGFYPKVTDVYFALQEDPKVHQSIE